MRVAARHWRQVLTGAIGLAGVACLFLAFFTGNHNVTVDCGDRVLLRAYAGGLWFIRSEAGLHGDRGSQVYLHRAESTQFAMWRTTSGDRGAYREWSIPALWVSGACALLWAGLSVPMVLDWRRRWTFLFRAPCILAAACSAMAVASLVWMLTAMHGVDCIVVRAGSIELVHIPLVRDGFGMTATPVEWEKVTPRVLVPWVETITPTPGLAAGTGMPLASASGWKVGVPLFIPIGVLVFAAYFARKRLLARAKGACRKCGYDLAGLPAGAKCPECGRQPSP